MLLGLEDRAPDRVGRHALAIAALRVHDQQRARIEHGFRRLIGDEQPVAQKPDIGGKHTDAVRVMPREIGAHEVIGDFGGLGLVAAHAAGDEMGDGAEGAGLEGKHGRDD